MVRNYKSANRKWHRCIVCDKTFKPQRNGALYHGTKCRMKASRLYPLGPVPARADVIRHAYEELILTGWPVHAAVLHDACADAGAPPWVMQIVARMTEMQEQARRDGLRYVAFIPTLQARKIEEWMNR